MKNYHYCFVIQMSGYKIKLYSGVITYDMSAGYEAFKEALATIHDIHNEASKHLTVISLTII